MMLNIKLNQNDRIDINVQILKNIGVPKSFDCEGDLKLSLNDLIEIEQM